MAPRATQQASPQRTAEQELGWQAHRALVAMSHGFPVKVWARGAELRGRILRVDREHPLTQEGGGSNLRLWLEGQTVPVPLVTITSLERA